MIETTSGLSGKKRMHSIHKLVIGNINLLFLILSVAFPRWVLAQQQEPKVLGIDDAVNMALSNHPDSRNAALGVDAARTKKAASIQFDATQFTWEHGQIYSPVRENRITVIQNFGSPLAHYQQSRYFKNEIDLKESEQKITQKQLIAKVKEAYFTWVHGIAVKELRDQEEWLFGEFMRLAGLYPDTADRDRMAKIMAGIRYSNVQRKQLIADEQLKIAFNRLKSYIYSDEEYRPSQTVLELYSIKFPIGTTDKFDPYTFRDYYQQQAERHKIALSAEKARFFPEFSAGYFHQSLQPHKNLQGFQLGISAPLVFFSQAQRVKEAKINSEIAANIAEKQTFEIQRAVDDLKTRLDQQFINIVYYKETALAQAEQLIKTSIQNTATDGKVSTIYLESVSEAFKMKEEYLITLLNYNLTALELEYMLN